MSEVVSGDFIKVSLDLIGQLSIGIAGRLQYFAQGYTSRVEFKVKYFLYLPIKGHGQYDIYKIDSLFDLKPSQKSCFVSKKV